MLLLLKPLSKWRVLSLSELVEFGNKRVSYWHVQRVVSRFEKAKILKSFKDPWSGRKLVYFEALGKGMHGLESSLGLNDETLLHDFKVSDVCRSFLKRDVFKDVSLEHELSRRQFMSGERSPDALILGSKNKVPFSLAFELELTRKANERIVTKGKHYLDMTSVDYVLYLFCTESLFETYKRIFQESLPEGWNNKIMLIWNPSLITKAMNLSEGIAYFKNKEMSFDEIF